MPVTLAYLFFSGIQNFTPPTHPDHEDIVAFTTKLSTILEKINARLKKTEEYMSLLNLFHDINGAPVGYFAQHCY